MLLLIDLQITFMYTCCIIINPTAFLGKAHLTGLWLTCYSRKQDLTALTLTASDFDAMEGQVLANHFAVPLLFQEM